MPNYALYISRSKPQPDDFGAVVALDLANWPSPERMRQVLEIYLGEYEATTAESAVRAWLRTSAPDALAISLSVERIAEGAFRVGYSYSARKQEAPHE